MSDNWIQAIPRDPQFVPTKAAQKKALGIMEDFLPDAEEVNAEVTKKPRFFHPGGNWSGARCCNCKADISAVFEDDPFMDDREFSSLMIRTPCCKKEVSLNDLDFVWPAGFARFVIEAMNPNVKKLSKKQMAELEKLLGCELRQIFLHL